MAETWVSILEMALGRKPDPREQYESAHTPGFCPPPRKVLRMLQFGPPFHVAKEEAEGKKPGPMSRSRLSAQPTLAMWQVPGALATRRAQCQWGPAGATQLGHVTCIIDPRFPPGAATC